MLAIMIAVFIFACIAYCVYIGISLRPSDLQVAVHYTAYGETNFYREKWYYLISFIGFGALLALTHTTLAMKIYAQGRREIAMLFILLSMLILLVAWFMTWSVLRIAFL